MTAAVSPPEDAAPQAAGVPPHASAATYAFPTRKQRRGVLTAPLTAFLAVAACEVCGDQFVPQPGVLCCERHRPRHVA